MTPLKQMLLVKMPSEKRIISDNFFIKHYCFRSKRCKLWLKIANIIAHNMSGVCLVNKKKKKRSIFSQCKTRWYIFFVLPMIQFISEEDQSKCNSICSIIFMRNSEHVSEPIIIEITENEKN